MRPNPFFAEDEYIAECENGPGDGYFWPVLGSSLFVEPTDDTPQEARASGEVLGDRSWMSVRPHVFKTAGDFIIQSLISGGDGGMRGPHLFTILYLYRHCIELRLKEILSQGIGRRVLTETDVTQTAMQRHSLGRLWECTEPFFVDCPDLVEALPAAKCLVLELDSIDPDGQTLRYAFDRKGADNLIQLSTVKVDLLKLRENFMGLWGYLRHAHGILGEMVEVVDE